MSISNLTAKHRPQTFAEVAGQDGVKTILSRASRQDKVAPAYLFSGTRGVGKTTIARIYAKALNCETAPTAEPCNQCSNCRQITAGAAVDVVEIDGASNRGIDDARRLKEDIGYAPVECRYKVFIIDEAHMLTKEAFNALLKTLEEPPPRATFIMATTEPHKFPATIVSRCQHYTFKMLPQAELVTHLENIMAREELQYEPGALQIIAKRGAGSVRDSMSLLGQALALDEDVLRETSVRNFLGLAGQDVFFQLMEGMHARNLIAVGQVLRQVLDQGLDLGFFLRELGNCWRNMYLLGQAGEEALDLLGLSGEEAEQWLEWSGKFAAPHVHACWQMTLDGQKKVMSSLEPALALELLLLNLTSLPDLIPLDRASAPIGQSGGPPPKAPSSGGPAGGQRGGPSGSGGLPPGNMPPPSGQRIASPPPSVAAPVETQSVQPSEAPPSQPPVAAPDVAEAPSRPQAAVEPSAPPSSIPPGPRDWEGFVRFVGERNGDAGVKAAMLRLNKGERKGDELVITCGSKMQCSQLSENKTFSALDHLVREYFGSMVEVRVETGDIAVRKSDRQLKEEAESHPGVQKIMDAFSAQMMSVSPRKQ